MDKPKTLATFGIHDTVWRQTKQEKTTQKTKESKTESTKTTMAYIEKLKRWGKQNPPKQQWHNYKVDKSMRSCTTEGLASHILLITSITILRIYFSNLHVYIRGMYVYSTASWLGSYTITTFQ